MAPSPSGESSQCHVPGAWPGLEDEHDEQNQVQDQAQTARRNPCHVPGSSSSSDNEIDVASDSDGYHSAEEVETHATVDEYLNDVTMEESFFSDEDYQLSEQEASIMLGRTPDPLPDDQRAAFVTPPTTRASMSALVEPTEEETQKFACLFHVAQQRGLIPPQAALPTEEEIANFVRQFNAAHRRGLIPSQVPSPEPPVPRGPSELEGDNSWSNWSR
ncbi:hypothetical protein ACJZ2D_001329 [Fusarium nematophilum]